jgi:hypothetical protein
LARLLWPMLACITVGTCFAGPAYVSTENDKLNTPAQAELAPETPFSWLDEVWDYLMFRLNPLPVAETLSLLDEFAPPPAKVVKTSLCIVEPLPPLNDPEALQFEGDEEASGMVDTLSLTPETVTALNRLQSSVTKFGGNFVVTSAYRPPAYQEHLQAVWDRWRLLQRNKSKACQALKEEVGAEFEKHQLLRRQRPVAFSDHTRGIGFDARVLLPRRTKSRRRVSIDRLARAAGVHRPDVRRDPVHFRLVAAGF